MAKILLVEDDKSLREIYGVRLLAEGYDIVSAGDGEEALAMAIKEKPNLIISDVMMPKISGFDMLDILRSTTETRDIKVIMMTALSSEDQRARGEQLGADKYLVKSQVGIEDVVRTVHEVLGDSKSVAPGADLAAAAVAPAVAPAVDEVKPVDEPAEPVIDEPTDSALSAPGNDSAGPLPPQPGELASSLPQPTAPFSSPRPSNLGEQVIHLDGAEPEVTPPVVPEPEVPTVVPESEAPINPDPSTPAESVVVEPAVDESAVEPDTPPSDVVPPVDDVAVAPIEPADSKPEVSAPVSPEVTPPVVPEPEVHDADSSAEEKVVLPMSDEDSPSTPSTPVS